MTKTMSRWVVGTDGSHGAEHAVDWCCATMPGRARALHLVRAWQFPELDGGGFATVPDVDVEPEGAHPHLDRIAARCADVGIELTSTVEYGRTTSVILDASTDADLLVLGTRGLGGFGPLLLGSVSHQCATHARTPIAIVPRSAAVDEDTDRIVVGMDRSAGACAALRWSSEFAGAGSTILVVGAWQPSSWGASIDVYAQAADHDEARARFDSIVDEFETTVPTLTIERHFAGGHAADVLLDAADGADLVVVGGRGHRDLAAPLLGSTATEVLHRATQTTVIVPAPRSDA